jgi:biopolymer transport protein ExbB
VIQTLIDGGPVMIPIGLCSIVALAVFVERLWALRSARVAPPALIRQVRDLARQRRVDEALQLVRGTDVAYSRLARAALLGAGASRAVLKERVEEVGRREAAELEWGVPVIGTIASIGPLLGLLGTVSGMIQTFSVIQTGGIGDPGALAGGISEALITTFAGLVVGIPAMVGNRYLLARVDRFVLALEEAALDLVDTIAGDGEITET